MRRHRRRSGALVRSARCVVKMSAAAREPLVARLGPWRCTRCSTVIWAMTTVIKEVMFAGLIHAQPRPLADCLAPRLPRSASTWSVIIAE